MSIVGRNGLLDNFLYSFRLFSLLGFLLDSLGVFCVYSFVSIVLIVTSLLSRRVETSLVIPGSLVKKDFTCEV